MTSFRRRCTILDFLDFLNIRFDTDAQLYMSVGRAATYAVQGDMLK
jgi:hypothetical protein